jgi:hypothetical protein
MEVLLKLLFFYTFFFCSKLTKIADTLYQDLTCISVLTRTLSV